FLFKLLTDPGDAVLTATPSYPLFEHLASLELVELRTFALAFHGRWELDPAAVRAALTPKTRALITVHPNNPTGSYLGNDEQRALIELAQEHDLALVSDEVFYDFPLDAFAQRAPTAAAHDEVLTFALGGPSKSAGLPH